MQHEDFGAQLRHLAEHRSVAFATHELGPSIGEAKGTTKLGRDLSHVVTCCHPAWSQLVSAAVEDMLDRFESWKSRKLHYFVTLPVPKRYSKSCSIR